MPLFDAHCHLQDARLAGARSDLGGLYRRFGVEKAVVNATCEEDWGSVATLAEEHGFVFPSFGLHPWHVNDAREGWQERLSVYWDRFPNSGVGEIGLDRWIDNYDLPAQREAFRWQLEFARKRDRPASVHCLQAWGALQDTLRSTPLPERGFLLHSFGGSRELIEPLAKLGAYFSISPYFAHERKEKQRQALKTIPLDRLLIETDAPDMAGPTDRRSVELRAPDGSVLNHPINIVSTYAFVAELFEMSQETLEDLVFENWNRLFG